MVKPKVKRQETKKSRVKKQSEVDDEDLSLLEVNCCIPTGNKHCKWTQRRTFRKGLNYLSAKYKKDLFGNIINVFFMEYRWTEKLLIVSAQVLTVSSLRLPWAWRAVSSSNVPSLPARCLGCFTRDVSTAWRPRAFRLWPTVKAGPETGQQEKERRWLHIKLWLEMKTVYF